MAFEKTARETVTVPEAQAGAAPSALGDVVCVPGTPPSISVSGVEVTLSHPHPEAVAAGQSAGFRTSGIACAHRQDRDQNGDLTESRYWGQMQVNPGDWTPTSIKAIIPMTLGPPLAGWQQDITSPERHPRYWIEIKPASNAQPLTGLTCEGFNAVEDYSTADIWVRGLPGSEGYPPLRG